MPRKEQFKGSYQYFCMFKGIYYTLHLLVFSRGINSKVSVTLVQAKYLNRKRMRDEIEGHI